MVNRSNVITRELKLKLISSLFMLSLFILDLSIHLFHHTTYNSQDSSHCARQPLHPNEWGDKLSPVTYNLFIFPVFPFSFQRPLPTFQGEKSNKSKYKSKKGIIRLTR